MSRRRTRAERAVPNKREFPDFMSFSNFPNKTLSPAEIRRRYAPARTLGASEAVWMAMDNQVAATGTYTLIQHAMEMGQLALPQFVGYQTLQGLAQNGLIRACVETTTDDLTREWITVRQAGDFNNAGAAEVENITREIQRYKLQKIFHNAAELVGYEGGCLIFIDTGVDGDALLTPLTFTPSNAELANGGLKRFVVIDPINVFPGKYNSTNPLRSDYYVPQTWWILGKEVHASRLVRIVANECPIMLKAAYNFFGIAQAQILWDYVLHFQECRTAAARLLTKYSLTIFKTDLGSVLYSQAGTQQLDRRIQFFVQNRDNDGIPVIDKDTEDIVKVESTLSGVVDIVRQSLELLSALNRTPAVKLLGISPAGFNATGESDLRNYYDHIKSQQEKILRNALAKCIRAIQISSIGKVNEEISFDFNELRPEDKKAVASYQKTKAEAAALYLSTGALSSEEIRQQLVSDPDSGYTAINPSQKVKVPGNAAQGMSVLAQVGKG